MEMEDEPKPEAPFYSPDQQKTIRQGLRILVRIAVRAHVQRPAPSRAPEFPGAGNERRGPSHEHPRETPAASRCLVGRRATRPAPVKRVSAREEPRHEREGPMNDRTEPTPAALYARVSSDRQDVDLSVAAQLRALREHADRNGYVVVREYVDEAESGRVDDRPEFNRMIGEAKSPQAAFPGDSRLEVLALHQEA